MCLAMEPAEDTGSQRHHACISAFEVTFWWREELELAVHRSTVILWPPPLDCMAATEDHSEHGGSKSGESL